MKRAILTITAVLALTGGAHAALADDAGWQVGSDSEISCAPIGTVYPGIESPEQLGDGVSFSSPDMAIYTDPNSGPRILARSKAKCLGLLNYMRGPQRAEHLAQAVDDLRAQQNKPAPRQWYAATTNDTKCIASRSPAERIRMIQEAGQQARTRDFTNAAGELVAVEVSYDKGDGYEGYYVYFRNKADCTASLPKNQPVASKYE